MVPDDVRYVRIGSTAVRSKKVRLGLRSAEFYSALQSRAGL